MTWRPSSALVATVAATVVLASCGGGSGVLFEESRQLAPPDTAEPPDTTAEPPATAVPPTTDPGGPGPTLPPAAGDLLREGDGKPPRSADDTVRRAVADLEQWWAEVYPEVYGVPYRPLEGGVWPVYPSRTDSVPGCGASETSYRDIQLMIAFYCSLGDFIAYDDGDRSLLHQLADGLESDAVLAIVMAHEWGHAIQDRNGDLRGQHTTIVTEQQADCFAGAWTARAVDGEATGLTLEERDVRAGLIAMIEVRDPIGTSPDDPGAHGSGFDRVGAYQVGYLEGAERCAELIDDPLPLMPVVFRQTGNPSGDAPWGYESGQILGFLPDDMNDYWQGYFERTGGEFPELGIVPVQSASEIDCDDPVDGIVPNVVFCPGSDDIYFNEPFAREMYDTFGDFALGYLFGAVWADVAQQQWSSPLDGRRRSLLNDCLVGTYARDVTPVPSTGLPQGGREGAVIEPGDYDEAIQIAIWLSDDQPGDDHQGTAFQKVDSFRNGAITGVEACAERLDGGQD